MKAQLLMLSVAGLLWTADASPREPAAVKAYIDRAEQVATTKLAAAGVNLNGPATVTGFVDSAGRLSAVQLVRSSGSRDADEAIEDALKHVTFEDPTAAGLLGARVTLTLPKPAQ